MYKLTTNDGTYYLVQKPSLLDAQEYLEYKFSQGLKTDEVKFEYVEIKRKINVNQLIKDLRASSQADLIRAKSKISK